MVIQLRGFFKNRPSFKNLGLPSRRGADAARRVASTDRQPASTLASARPRVLLRRVTQILKPSCTQACVQPPPERRRGIEIASEKARSPLSGRLSVRQARTCSRFSTLIPPFRREEGMRPIGETPHEGVTRVNSALTFVGMLQTRTARTRAFPSSSRALPPFSRSIIGPARAIVSFRADISCLVLLTLI